MHRRELQGLCASLKSKSKDLADRLGEVQSSFEQERQGKEEVERALEVSFVFTVIPHLPAFSSKQGSRASSG